MDYKNELKIFKAFSDIKRIEILNLLKTGEQCACVLLEKLDLTQSGLSYHMKILVESGVVNSRQDGKWSYYKISKDGRDNAVEKIIALTNVINDSDSCG